MTNQPSPRPDPFLDEVQNLKRIASESAGNDIRRLGAQLAEIERRFVGEILPPPSRHSPPGKVA